MDRKQQGNIGEAFAIFYYTKSGCIVSKPLSENTPYDLIVDNGNKILRIQVKTSSYKRYPNGGYTVQLKTNGGNQSGKGKSSFIDKNFVDVVFVLCEDGNYYSIPSDICENKSNIIVSPKSIYHVGVTYFDK